MPVLNVYMNFVKFTLKVLIISQVYSNNLHNILLQDLKKSKKHQCIKTCKVVNKTIKHNKQVVSSNDFLKSVVKWF